MKPISTLVITWSSKTAVRWLRLHD